MSSANSVSLAPLAAEKFDRSGLPSCHSLPPSLRGPLSRIGSDLSAALEADLVAARWDRAGGPFRRAPLIGLLFATAFPVRTSGQPALQSVFAAEAMRRARTMFGLVLLLEENSWHGAEPWYPDVSPLTLQHELARAKTLVTLFETLDLESGPVSRSCGATLRGALSGFVELFGPGIGEPRFEAEIETLRLTGVKRRALVLAATELIGSAMLYGVGRPHAGTFRAILRHRAGRSAEFILEHEGDPVELAPAGASSDVLNAMATLLEARLSGQGSARRGAAIRLHFPC